MDGCPIPDTLNGGRRRCAHCRGVLWIHPGIPGRAASILWLIAEDMGQHLGCYGATQVWTPDRMAAEGVKFTRFFTMALDGCMRETGDQGRALEPQDVANGRD